MASYLHEAKQQINEENVKEYVQSQVLGKGHVVPGFGHAVLRATDPRFTLQHKFAQKTIHDDELTQ